MLRTECLWENMADFKFHSGSHVPAKQLPLIILQILTDFSSYFWPPQLGPPTCTIKFFFFFNATEIILNIAVRNTLHFFRCKPVMVCLSNTFVIIHKLCLYRLQCTFPTSAHTELLMLQSKLESVLAASMGQLKSYGWKLIESGLSFGQFSMFSGFIWWLKTSLMLHLNLFSVKNISHICFHPKNEKGKN